MFKFLEKNKGYKIANSTKISSSYEQEDEEYYSCDGKVYCSEMNSCEEAKFYQDNCTGTKMDGDHDGIPCESQWCSSFW